MTKPLCSCRRRKGDAYREVSDLSIADHLKAVDQLILTDNEATIARPILKEIKDRLTFLNNVGLNYLTLSRSAGTLSGGESQRIRLATQIGSNLSGVLYILDEPSIGLHQRDNDRLIASLKKMRDLGNTLIVVEHDEDTMREADYLIDVGPGAGVFGERSLQQELQSRWLATANPSRVSTCLANARFRFQQSAVQEMDRSIEITGASENNLQDITARFPLGKFIAVTGVSGSGKSTLINGILKKPSLKSSTAIRKTREIQDDSGIEHIDRLIDIDQSPIGRTPRSNPATYTGVFDDIRDLFAQTNEAKIRGYKKAALVSMSRAGVVKPAQEMGSSRLKCTSCRMSSSLVKSATDVVTIVRPSKSTTRKKILQKCWI